MVGEDLNRGLWGIQVVFLWVASFCSKGEWEFSSVLPKSGGGEPLEIIAKMLSFKLYPFSGLE